MCRNCDCFKMFGKNEFNTEYVMNCNCDICYFAKYNYAHYDYEKMKKINNNDNKNENIKNEKKDKKDKKENLKFVNNEIKSKL